MTVTKETDIITIKQSQKRLEKKGEKMRQTNKPQKIYYTAAELSELLGISLGYSYKIIKQLNAELEKAGYMTLSGKVSARYFEKRWYGYGA